jgi:hypothetical protein
VSEKLPVGIHNAYWFEGFNAISWQICLGGPLILFARELGASATTIGLLAGLAPLMMVFQLPVSRYAEDIGYRKLMLLGWGTRVFMLIFLTGLPALGWILPSTTLVNLLLAIMFFFTLLRGISSCAWLPWMSTMIPENLRGEYLSHNRRFINIASVIALLVSGAVLAHQSMVGFMIVFLLSFISGAISLHFLNRVPSLPSSGEVLKIRSDISWLEIFRNTTFLQLLGFSIFAQLTLCANPTFIVVYLRDEIQFQNSTILWLSAGSALMGILAINRCGKNTDRIGSKPYLGLVLTWCLISLFCWFLTTINAMKHPGILCMALMLLGGFFGTIFEISVTRLLMNTVGNKRGQTQYFAVYAVVMSLVMGTMPAFWGIVLDAIHHRKWVFFDLELSRFSIYFGIQWLMLFAVLSMLTRVKEPKSKSTSSMIYEIFVGMPARGLTFLFQRRQ